jgi:hypothetical protein
MSVRGSAAPPETRTRLLTGIDDWLAAGYVELAEAQGESGKAGR